MVSVLKTIIYTMLINVEVNNTCLANSKRRFCPYCSYIQEMANIENANNCIDTINATLLLVKFFKRPLISFAGKEPFRDINSINCIKNISKKLVLERIFHIGVILSPLHIEKYKKYRKGIKQKIYLEVSINSLNEFHDISRGFSINSQYSEVEIIKKEILSGNLSDFSSKFGDILGVSCVLFRENLEEIPNMIKKLLNVGIQYFSLGTVKEGVTKNFSLTSDEIKYIVSILRKLSETNPNLRISLTIYPRSIIDIDKLFSSVLNPYKLNLSLDSKYPQLPCISITPNFKVVPLIGAFSIGHIIRISHHGLIYFSTHPRFPVSIPFTDRNSIISFLKGLYGKGVMDFYKSLKYAVSQFVLLEDSYPFFDHEGASYKGI